MPRAAHSVPMHGNLCFASKVLPHLMPIQSGGTPLILGTSTAAAWSTAACRLLGELIQAAAASTLRLNRCIWRCCLCCLELDVHWLSEYRRVPRRQGVKMEKKRTVPIFFISYLAYFIS